MTRLLTTSLLTLAAATVTSGLLLASGCSGTKRPYEVRADPFAPQQVYIADKRLSSLMRFGDIQTTRDQTDLLYVTVPLRATASRRQLIEYRFTFFDETGTPLPGGAWQTEDLESNVQEVIRGNSTSPRAADFRLDIREAEAG